MGFYLVIWFSLSVWIWDLPIWVILVCWVFTLGWLFRFVLADLVGVFGWVAYLIDLFV